MNIIFRMSKVKNYQKVQKLKLKSKILAGVNAQVQGLFTHVRFDKVGRHGYFI